MKHNRIELLPDGRKVRVPNDLRKKLNLSYLEYTNKTHAVGAHDLPALSCDTYVLPDFIALTASPALFTLLRLPRLAFGCTTMLLMAFMGFTTQFITRMKSSLRSIASVTGE